MFPTAFDEENGVLGPPEGMTEDDCTSLSVFRGPDANGELVVISCWKPTAEELEEIIRTKRVWLFIWGPTMPPAALTGLYPFERKEDK